MTLISTAAQNKSLDNDYGSTKGPNAPAAHELALFYGDPAAGGTELTSAGGYARVVVTNNGTNWPAAASGAKTSAEQTFLTSTGAWSSSATHFALIDHADGTTIWDTGPLDDEVLVDQANTVVKRTVTVFYNPVF